MPISNRKDELQPRKPARHEPPFLVGKQTPDQAKNFLALCLMLGMQFEEERKQRFEQAGVEVPEDEITALCKIIHADLKLRGLSTPEEEQAFAEINEARNGE